MEQTKTIKLTRSQFIRLIKACITAGQYGLNYKWILKIWDKAK